MPEYCSQVDMTEQIPLQQEPVRQACLHADQSPAHTPVPVAPMFGLRMNTPGLLSGQNVAAKKASLPDVVSLDSRDNPLHVDQETPERVQPAYMTGKVSHAPLVYRPISHTLISTSVHDAKSVARPCTTLATMSHSSPTWVRCHSTEKQPGHQRFTSLRSADATY